MKFPKLTELDRDQAAIYNGAPTDQSVLISGPPGTGKTVIAFHRAHTLAHKKKKPTVAVYNKVLAQYTGNRSGIAESVPVTTVHKWTASWWRSVSGPKVDIPSMDGNRFNYDWGAVRDAALKRASGDIAKLNWGHLIIDEGQDFPASMYSTLKVVKEVYNAKGADPAMEVTVLADENQRLSPERNSTLTQIRQALGLDERDRNVYQLKKNYRNTRQIAEFAACFCAGLPTGVAEMPTRIGPRPVVSVLPHDTHKQCLNACVEKIVKYAKAHPTEEIGVIAASDSSRKSMYNRLSSRLDGEDGVGVQTYAWNDGTDAKDLEFDSPGRITVLNYQSAKGLEFDAAFLVDIGQVMRSEGSSTLAAKMILYVMCSRARAFLNLMLVKDDAAEQIVSWISGHRGLYEQEVL